MSDEFVSIMTGYDLPRCVVMFFGLFLFVWLFKLGLNTLIRLFDKI